jgi:hypothetical protein
MSEIEQMFLYLAIFIAFLTLLLNLAIWDATNRIIAEIKRNHP